MTGVTQAVFMNQRSFGAPPGQQAYTTPGTYTWVAPTGVTSVSVVVVGAGGQGGGRGGGGGGLAYKNNMTVTPGSSYTVKVGTSTTSVPVAGEGTSSFAAGTTVSATTGQSGWNGCNPATGGTGSGGDANRTGGNGASGSFTGGGGAAGYSGNGGAGGGATSTAGSGGGASGGVSGSIYNAGCCCCLRQGGGSGGGGVGLKGEGTSGASVSSTYLNATQPGGKKGSCGNDGDAGQGNSAAGNGGLSGGGGGGGGSTISSRGGYGGVRIIWPGNTRSYPSTCTGDK